MSLNPLCELERNMTGPDDDSVWIAYDSGLPRLSGTFESVFSPEEDSPVHSFKNFVRTSGPNELTGLEVAGQGKIFEQLGIRGVATCLGIPPFLRDKGSYRRNTQNTVSLVEGDISDPDTRERISQRFETEQLSPPNLVLFTPAGGIDHIPQTSTFYGHFIDWLLNTADKQRLLLVGEFPKKVTDYIHTHLDTLRVKEGYETSIKTHSDGGVFRISRF